MSYLFYEYKKQNIFGTYLLVLQREKSCINQSGTGYNKSINPKRYLKGKRKKIEEFIIDEKLIKIGSELIDMALGFYYRISE